MVFCVVAMPKESVFISSGGCNQFNGPVQFMYQCFVFGIRLCGLSCIVAIGCYDVLHVL